MKSLSRLLTVDRILWLDCSTKNECLRAMVECLATTGDLLPKTEEIYQSILDREKLLSTGFGLGLAIPHAKLKGISDFIVGLGIHKAGVDFDSFDKDPVRVLVMILGPETPQQEYLKVLSRVTAFLKDNRERLLTMDKAKDIFELTYDY